MQLETCSCAWVSESIFCGWVPFHVLWNMVEHLLSHHEGCLSRLTHVFLGCSEAIERIGRRSKQACRHGAFHVLCATEVNTKIITT